jgi:two-component system chemotaxis response regulator CheB
MSREIRVLLADDSPTMRRALTMLLSQDTRLEVIGTARDGEEVLQMARFLKPDVLSMDVQMPKLDGLEATRQIMASCPCPIVVVSSHSEDAELNLSFNAIQAGAVEITGKPKTTSEEGLKEWGKSLADLMVKVSQMPLKVPGRPLGPRPTAPKTEGHPVEVFGLAASTGGPPALAELLRHLPAALPIPILIAQHITEGFTVGFQKWLSQSCALAVEIAQDGKAPSAGHVYLAPDGCHLEVERGLLRTPRQTGGVCPSGDRLFRSLAKTHGAQAGGAVLTGMGEDGGRGLLELKQAGGVTLAQDEASCVVYGMPNFARSLGAVGEVLTPEGMAAFIGGLCKPGIGLKK